MHVFLEENKDVVTKEDKMREKVLEKYKNVDYDAELSDEEREAIREKVIKARANAVQVSVFCTTCNTFDTG